MHLTRRAASIQPSETLAMTAKANALRAQGQSVINFAGGELDCDTPAHIKDAAVQALRDGKTKYTPSSGIPELREAVCRRLADDYALTYTPQQVIISNGAKHSIWNALQVLCQEGDDVLITSPYWVSYPPLVQLAGATPRIITTTEDAQFKLTPDALQSHLTRRTRVLILNSPSNPTGTLYTRDELQALADIICAHDLMVISDEIYEHLVYAPHQHHSVAAIDDTLRARTIRVSGVSKTYAMTGWRIGYLTAPLDVAQAIDRVQSHSTSNPCSVSQYAALAALTGPQTVIESLRQSLVARRDLMVEGLRGIPELTCLEPQGAFYVFCNIQGLGMDALTIGNRWLDDARIAVVPGTSFGSDQHVRCSFSTDDASIRDGIQRITAWVRQYACATS